MVQPDSLPRDVVDRLVSALDAYDQAVSPHYDEVLHEVSGRVEEARSIGKADIGGAAVLETPAGGYALGALADGVPGCRGSGHDRRCRRTCA